MSLAQYLTECVQRDLAKAQDKAFWRSFTDDEGAGSQVTSYIQADQIRTVSQKRLARRLGVCDQVTLGAGGAGTSQAAWA